THRGGFWDVFVTKLNSAGSALAYSTYLGGSGEDDPYDGGIAVDTSGNAYIVGWTSSLDFPTSSGAFQPIPGGSYDAFVTKLDAGADSLIYSTYLGGSGWDEGNGIAIDADGNAYVTGNTASVNFPTTPGAF